ncbi:MAG: MlaD family protein [Pseudomonadota bacterium]
METKANYTLIGLFVITLMVGIVVITLWLYESLTTKSYKTYITYMNESVAGLSPQAPVKYNGVNVGYVSNIRLNLKNPEQVILTLKIEQDVPITQNTVAILTEQGITGIAYIGLRGAKGNELINIGPGQKYPVIKSEPSFLTQLDATIRSLSKNIQEISNKVQQVVSQKNIENFDAMLANVKKITQTFSDNSTEINTTIKDLKVLMHNTANVSKRFPQTINEIQAGTLSLKKMADSVDATSISLKKAVKQTNITIQSIGNQITPKLYDTLDSINSIADNLKILSAELNQNPSIVLRGKTPPPLGPGEK